LAAMAERVLVPPASVRQRLVEVRP